MIVNFKFSFLFFVILFMNFLFLGAQVAEYELVSPDSVDFPNSSEDINLKNLEIPESNVFEEVGVEESLLTNLSNDFTNQANTIPPPEIIDYTEAQVEAILKGVENLPDIEEKLIPEDVPQIKKPIEGWGNFRLGLSYQEIRAVLSNEYPWMVLRPQEEGINSERIFFLETFKNDFFTKIQFQFDNDHRLYLLRLEMNPRYFSFTKIYNRLFDLYGPPHENSYLRVTWRDMARSLEINRDHTVTYMDRARWDEILPQSPIEDQRKELLNTVFDNL